MAGLSPQLWIAHAALPRSLSDKGTEVLSIEFKTSFMAPAALTSYLLKAMC